MTNKHRDFNTDLSKSIKSIPFKKWIESSALKNCEWLNDRFSLSVLADKKRSDQVAEIYQELIQVIESQILAGQKGLVQQLFPYLFSDDQFAFLMDSRKNYLFYTAQLEDLIQANWKINISIDFLENWSYWLFIQTILQKIYSKTINLIQDPIIELINGESHCSMYLQLSLNYDFLKVTQLKEILAPNAIDFKSIKSWEQNLNSDSVLVEGFIVGQLIDVSRRELLARLEEFMVTDESNVEYDYGLHYVQNIARSYFQNVNIDIGSVYVLSTLWREFSDWTILRSFEKELYQSAFFEDKGLYSQALLSHKPSFSNDLATQYLSGLEKKILQKGYLSLLVAPVFNRRKEIVGLVEFASNQKGAFDHRFMKRLEDFTDVFEMGMNSFIQEIDQQVSLVIQKKFTPIHQSVEWKFREVALEYYWAKTSNKHPEDIGNIQFSEVFPLYAQVDIVGSTNVRKQATIRDLTENLEKAIELITLVDQVQSTETALNHLKNLNYFHNLLNNEALNIKEEKVISTLISEEIPVFLREIKKDLPSPIQEKIEWYFSLLDPKKSLIYRHRNYVDNTVSAINSFLLKKLSLSNEGMQKLLPHFIEHSLTDGLEFDVFIGQSILEHRKFDVSKRKDFKLWQLKLLCEMIIDLSKDKVLKKSELKLSVLVLAYPQTIDIHFREDEKRFDVQGSEGVRYETFKKRIEKAYISDSMERLTTSGKMSIVYFDEVTKLEYLAYLQTLKTDRLIHPNIEDLSLDLASDNHGTGALRVQILTL